MAVENTGAESSALASLHIGNLHPDITDSQLYDAFSEFKTLTSVRVCRHSSTAVSLSYGYVNFISTQDALHAIEKKNNSCLNGQIIKVTWSVGDRVGSDPTKFTNIYIKNLDPEVTPEQLFAKFSEFGEIVSFAISKDDNGFSRGFGFVNFENSDDAKKALDAMNGSQLGSKVLYVARAQTKSEREEFLHRQFEEIKKERILKYQDSNTYVKNISDEVTDQQLRELFSQCGTVVSEKIMRDNKGINRGFGFVCFSNPNEAIKAVETFHGFMFHRKPLYVAIAQNKEDRRAQLQMKMACEIATRPPSIIPGSYPPVFPWVPMYNPLGMRPGWRPTDFAFRPPPVPLIHSNLRQQMLHRAMIYSYGQQSHGGSRATSYLPPMKQSNQQPSRRAREMNNTAGNAVASVQEASNMLSSMLAAAPPEQQKQILGDRLYPLVRQHKPNIAEKITGMLLELDNSELLVLLETPESLVAKVEEAVKVLNLSNTTGVSSQDAI